MKQTLVGNALDVGWKHSSFNVTVLTRKVSYKTKSTQFTQIFQNNDSASEHISITNLKYCGKNSRVWKKINTLIYKFV